MVGNVQEANLKLVFDDETDWNESIALPLVYPSWKDGFVEVPGAHIGKTIVSIILSWKANDDYVYFDDVEVYVV